MIAKKNALEAEWSLFQRKEESFLASREVKKESYLNQKLADKVPAKLQGQLDKAFAKALDGATGYEPRVTDVLSTKGSL